MGGIEGGVRLWWGEGGGGEVWAYIWLWVTGEL